MQRLLLIGFLVVAFASCQKEIQSPRNNDYPDLKQNLLENLSASDYNALDYSRVSRSVYGEATLLRIAFKGKNMKESFVLVDVTSTGKIKRGRIVQLTRDSRKETYNGNLLLKSLKGEIMEESSIINGYRRSNKTLVRTMVVEDPYITLPLVVVTGSYPSDGSGISWSSWYNLLFFLDAAYGDSWSGGYSGSDPYSGGGGSTGSGGADDEMLLVDFETQYDDPAIELDKFLKCFDNIADAGATCRITIYADVPVNSDPTKIMDWDAGSPGHSWIRMEKTNGSQFASQHIGFYPKTGWKTAITDAPLDGKFVDNGNHEFNASYEVTVSPENLRSAIMQIRQLGSVRYDIDDYNCTDWAIQVWRAAVSPGIWFDIPRFHLPGSLSPGGTSTPQGLYVKFKEMQQVGTPGVTVPLIGYSGNSTGPCN